MNVPKIIHQMWYDKVELDNELPPSKYVKYTHYMNSFKKYNPEYQYIFWNKRKVNNIFEEHLPEFREFFHNLRLHIEKCDFSRYAILYLYGGIYVDLDFECFNNLDSIIKDRELGWIYTRDVLSRVDNHISNGFMVSSKNNQTMYNLMTYIMNTYDKNIINPTYTTGPVKIFSYIESIGHNERDKIITGPLVGGEASINNEFGQIIKTNRKDGTNWQSDLQYMYVKNFLKLALIIFILFLIVLLIYCLFL